MSGLMFRFFAALAAFGLSASIAIAQDLPSLTSGQSGVTIKVKPKDLKHAVWEFDVVFDTHTQELKEDMMKSAVLVVDPRGTKFTPIEWKGDPPGGHHRKGVLRFKAVTPPPAGFELRIMRAGEERPRSFRWALK